jgi:hypothetical protein
MMISGSTLQPALLPIVKTHNQISIMHFHAQNMQKCVLERNSYAKLSTKVHARSCLEQPRYAAEKPDNYRMPQSTKVVE